MRIRRIGFHRLGELYYDKLFKLNFKMVHNDENGVIAWNRFLELLMLQLSKIRIYTYSERIFSSSA